jgi:hypothetical protein
LPLSTPAPRPRDASGRPRALALAACAVALIGALAGCGSSSSPGSSADPASVIPEAAALFAGATVHPSGSLKSAAETDGKDLTHQADPYLRLLGALQTPGSPQLNYSRDVAPWLGASAGVYLSSLSSAGPLLSLLEQSLLGGSSAAATTSFPFSAGGVQGALVLDTSDSAKADSFLKTQAGHAGAHATSYRGISYQGTSGGVAFALVDRLAVIGSESAVHSVIDTSLGGSSLARSSGYSKLLAKAPTGVLAHIYSNPTALASSPSSAGASTSGLLSLLSGGGQANISLVPGSGSLTLDADTLPAGGGTGKLGGSGAGLLSADPESAKALDELPGESWLAIGLGHLAGNLAQDVQGLKALGSLGSTPGVSATTSTLSIKSLIDAMTAPLSILGAPTKQAEQDFAGWMGSAGIFAAGSSLLELKAAIVIESKNAALSRAAVSKLAGQLRSAGGSLRGVSIPGTEAAQGVALTGLPLVLDIADGRASDGKSKFILGFGEASVEDALKPSSTMAGAETRSSASTALGEGIQPSIVFQVPTLLSLLEGIGLTEDPSISKFVPYLRAVATVSGGGRELGGEVERFRLALGLSDG